MPRARPVRCGRRSGSAAPSNAQRAPSAVSSSGSVSAIAIRRAKDAESSRRMQGSALSRRKPQMYDEDSIKGPPQSADVRPNERREFRSRLNGEYKKYTGKISKEYYVLGGLKPNLDTEELMQKRANKEKVKTFSRNLTALNREIIARQPQPISTNSTSALSKFERAKDYGKKVPRPRPRPNLVDADGDDTSDFSNPLKEMDELSIMEAEHQDRRRQAAKIREELGL